MPRIYACHKLGTIPLSLLFTVLSTALAAAAVETERLVPETTRAFISIPDLDAVTQAFDETQFGEMTAHPDMKPFIEDMEAQLNERFGQTGIRLGIDWNDIDDIVAGEVAIAVIEPEASIQKHALVLIADVTGKKDAVDKLLTTVQQTMRKRNAARIQKDVDGTTLTKYSVPAKDKTRRPFSVTIFVYEDQLFAVDHDEVAEALLAQAKSGNEEGTLSQVAAYQHTMQRCAREAGDLVPLIRWFFEPLGYSRVARSALPANKPRRNDILRTLEKQGFDALQGIGGYINLATADHELLLRGMVYAPAVPAAKEEKYLLAARILNGAKRVASDVQDWVPAKVSGYHTAAWQLKESFQYAETLIDEIAGEPGFFDDLKASLKEDPEGPQIDIDEEIVAHLGERVTIITDTVLPVTPESERILVAISLADPQAMSKGVDKIMKNDPDADKVVVDGHTIWEIIPIEEEELPGLDIENGFDDLDFDDVEEEEEEPLLVVSNAAIAVVEGHLMVSSHVELIAEIIKRDKEHNNKRAAHNDDQPDSDDQPDNDDQADNEDESDSGDDPEPDNDVEAVADEAVADDDQRDEDDSVELAEDNNHRLDTAADYRSVSKALTKLATNDKCLRLFARMDDAAEATYELFKDNRMPESKGLLGKILNRILGPKQKGVLREQKIDAQKLPDYELVRKYLGPAGAFVQIEPDGWFATAIVLRKEGAEPVDAPAAVSTASTPSDTTEQ